MQRLTLVKTLLKHHHNAMNIKHALPVMSYHLCMQPSFWLPHSEIKTDGKYSRRGGREHQPLFEETKQPKKKTLYRQWTKELDELDAADQSTNVVLEQVIRHAHCMLTAPNVKSLTDHYAKFEELMSVLAKDQQHQSDCIKKFREMSTHH